MEFWIISNAWICFDCAVSRNRDLRKQRQIWSFRFVADYCVLLRVWVYNQKFSSIVIRNLKLFTLVLKWLENSTQNDCVRWEVLYAKSQPEIHPSLFVLIRLPDNMHCELVRYHWLRVFKSIDIVGDVWHWLLRPSWLVFCVPCFGFLHTRRLWNLLFWECGTFRVLSCRTDVDVGGKSAIYAFDTVISGDLAGLMDVCMLVILRWQLKLLRDAQRQRFDAATCHCPSVFRNKGDRCLPKKPIICTIWLHLCITACACARVFQEMFLKRHKSNLRNLPYGSICWSDHSGTGWWACWWATLERWQCYSALRKTLNEVHFWDALVNFMIGNLFNCILPDDQMSTGVFIKVWALADRAAVA